MVEILVKGEMKMTLEEFINLKTQQLKENYKDVKFVYAIDIQLRKGGYSESISAKDTPLSKQIKEIKSFLSLPENEINGSRVMFEVKAPRKRKYEDVEFFVQWI